MGIVVLRSTTPWVAESSRSSSNLLTVISMVVVPAADAMASTGIERKPLTVRYFDYSLISNQKPIRPAVTVGRREKWKFNPTLTIAAIPAPTFVSKISPDYRARPSTTRSGRTFRSAYCTASTIHSQPLRRKTQAESGNRVPNRCSSAQLLSQLVQQPVQIFVALAHIFYLLDALPIYPCRQTAGRFPAR